MNGMEQGAAPISGSWTHSFEEDEPGRRSGLSPHAVLPVPADTRGARSDCDRRKLRRTAGAGAGAR